MLHGGIEKRLEIDPAFAFVFVPAHTQIAAQSGFSIECIGRNGGFQCEAKLYGNAFQ